MSGSWAKYIGEQYAEEADDNTLDSYFLTDIGGTLYFGTEDRMELYGGSQQRL